MGKRYVKLRKWTKLVRAVLKFFCKKDISPKEIHVNFIKTLGDEYLSYSEVKKWAGLLNLGEKGEHGG